MFLSLARQLERIEQRIIDMAHTLDDVLADTSAESTKIDSLLAFCSGLELQLKDALAGVSLPAGTQAKIDAVFDAIEKNGGKVQAALDANTPPSESVEPLPSPAGAGPTQ